MLTKDRVASMIEESDGRFLVDRAVYCDPEIYESEIDQFFENGWVFLAHEGQIAKPGDYFSTKMGRQPVFLVRKKDGGIGGYINACAHKAASLVPFESGRASAFTCRFHGWVFNAEGKCIKIKNEEPIKICLPTGITTLPLAASIVVGPTVKPFCTIKLRSDI